MFAASVDASGCAEGGLEDGLEDGLESDGVGLSEAGALVALGEGLILEGGSLPSSVQPDSAKQIPVAARLRIHAITHPRQERTLIR